MHYEYEGDVGEAPCSRLFSSDRVREAAVGTGWEVEEVEYDEMGLHYRVTLRKA